MSNLTIIIIFAVVLVIAAIAAAAYFIVAGKKDPEAVLKFIQWLVRIFVKSAEQQFKDEQYVVDGEILTKGEKKFHYVAEKIFRLLDVLGITTLDPDMVDDFIEAEVFDLPGELGTITFAEDEDAACDSEAATGEPEL